MFFSISMAVYNAGKYLDKCIESILAQTEDDYELILVNDGSKDNSLAICQRWQRDYPDKIKVIDKENTGSLLTRRVCLQESRGEYLYIMDADDYLVSKDMLAVIRKTIESNHCDMIFFECTTDGKCPYFQFPFAENTVFTNDRLNEIRKYFIQQNGLNPLWNKVFHRSLVDWDEDYSTYTEVTNGTDFFQSMPIIAAAKRVYYLNQIFYFYRTSQNENSIVHTFRRTIYISGKENCLRLKRYAETWNIPDVDQLLQRCCMHSVSTSVFKARLIKDEKDISKYEYIKSIGEDQFFLENFTLKGVQLSRKIILLLLKAKCYRLLSVLLTVIK